MFNPAFFYQSGKPASAQFVSTWKTDNTSAGSSTATQVKLPLVSTGTYNFIVDWGDGSSNTITTWNAAATTHTYSVAGTYTIKIKGICTGWNFNGFGDILKILSISSWGKLKLGTGGFFFKGCTNLNLSGITDILDLVGTTNLTFCFENCTALTAVGRINEWDMSSVTNLSAMFIHCVNFNQNLSGWNTQSVTNMSFLFHNTTNFNNGLASGVAGTLSWNTSAVTIMNNMFSNAMSFNCNIGSWNVSNVTSFNSMFNTASKFNNGGSSAIDNWVFKTTGTILMVDMFRSATIFNQSLNSWNTVAVTNMNNMFRSATSFNNGLASGVVGTLAWNTSAVTNMTSMFDSATSFNCNVGSWNVSLVTDFTSMFSNATKFNNGGSSTIDNWVFKTTGTIIMSSMFNAAALFNQPLNSWNTQAVTNMSSMFFGATNFNNGLASGVAGTLSWNTSAVTNMGAMFNRATSFNCNIGSWNVSSVADFAYMFSTATNFNNGGSTTIGDWTLKTTGTINMTNMFQRALAFNQPLNNWNTIAVNSLELTFSDAIAFNNGLASGVAGTLAWNTENVTNMRGTFRSDASNSFNCNVGSWNVSKVSNFSVMFANANKFNNGGSADINNWVLKTTGTINMDTMFFNSSVFNQPLNSWNTVAVTTMSGMFSNSLIFNQPLSGWNTTNVTDMNTMFSSANLFDQNLGSWNVSKVTNFSNFMNTKTPSTFSTTNLDAIYNGWSTRPVLPSKSISFGTAKYTSAASAGRAILTGSPNLWAITDGGL